MSRLWNRFVNMDDDRLTKIVFLWDKSLCKRNWSSELKHLFNNTGFEEVFESVCSVNVKLLQNILHQNYCNLWSNDIQTVNKLRTYTTFKQEYGSESYVSNVTNRQHRSAIAQFRCGVLLLK